MHGEVSTENFVFGGCYISSVGPRPEWGVPQSSANSGWYNVGVKRIQSTLLECSLTADMAKLFWITVRINRKTDLLHIYMFTQI